MTNRISVLILILLTGVPLWSQDNAGAQVTAADVTAKPDDTRMLTPPPASGEAYPLIPTFESRSNFLRAGVTFNAAYSDNVLGGVVGKPVSDTNYSVWPTIAVDETTTRLHSVFTYAPGFTFYQRTSDRDEADQKAMIDFQYRLSPHVTASLRDSFQKSSNLYNQPDLLSAGAVYGSTQAPTAAVIAPLADMLSNTGNVELTYQFSASEMIGASATFTNLHYPNPKEVPGLFDSSSRGGSAFYSHRLSKKHYVGALYQYSRILEFPSGPQFETETHTMSLFYTLYLTPALSLSFSGGPQHYAAAQSLVLASHSWSPAATASLGWQARRTVLAASYSRTVTGGGGLLGAFNSNSATATARWQVTRTWNIGSAANYAIYRNVGSLNATGNPGGHIVAGSFSLQHPIGEHFNVEAGYTRLHQSFNGIAAVATAPDTNREFISITYQFSRALGR
jgi:hypothetical protein